MNRRIDVRIGRVVANNGVATNRDMPLRSIADVLCNHLHMQGWSSHGKGSV